MSRLKEKTLEIFNGCTNIYDKYSKSYLFALLMNAFVLFFYLYYFYPHYDTNDDHALKSIVIGTSGMSDYHMVFINVIIGHLLKWLYSLGLRIDWYDFFLYILVYISLSTITYILLNKKRKSVLFSAAIFIVSYSLYVRPQFTKTASILAITGMLLFSMEKKDKRTYIITRISAVLFLVLASWIRTIQMFSCAFICLGLLFFDLIGIFEKKDSEQRKLSIDLISWGIITLLIVGITFVFDSLSYRDELWSYYIQYNNTRAVLVDEGFPDYQKNIELYQRLDIDEETIDFYQNFWMFDDPEKMSLDNMKELVKAKNKSISILDFYNPIIYTFTHFFTNKNTKVYMFFLLCCMILTVSVSSKKDRLKCLISSVFFILCIMIVSYLRPFELMNRVYHGLIFCLLFCLLFIYGNRRIAIKKTILLELILLLCVPEMLHVQIDNLRSWCQADYDKQFEESLAICHEVARDKEHIYMFGGSNITIWKKMFNHIEPGLMSNRISFGGWGTNSGWNKHIKETYHIVNPYRDCIDNEQVIVVSNRIDSIMMYINKYYDKKARAVPIYINGLDCYKIVTNLEN